MITSANELRQLCRRAQDAGRMAIDTEFFWERTFYPQLGVVQIGISETGVHLVDAVALPDLPGLGAVLAAPDIQLILHDAVQDLQILCRHTGSLPRHVFDTRRAAGFAGMLSTVSLSNLLQDTLDIHIPKAETRSNWLQRPLSEMQIEYALDDIRHLPALCDTLGAKATALGNRQAMEEDMRTYDDPSLYAEQTPDTVYQRQRSVRLNTKQRALLYTLFCWREEEARHLDRPRSHILQNADLMLLVRHCPGGMAALQSIPGLSRHLLQRHRQAILTAVERAATLDPDAIPATGVPARLSADIRHKAEGRLAAIKAKATAAGIDPALIGSKADITAWVRFETEGGTAPPALLQQGWRKRFLADMPLVPLEPETEV